MEQVMSSTNDGDAMTTETATAKSWQEAIDPHDPLAWGMIADWLDIDQGDPERAELVRLDHTRDRTPEESARRLELLQKGVKPWIHYRTNSIGMKFAFIPQGKFLMGSPEDEPDRYSDERLHEVEINRGFYAGVYAVTQHEYETVMEVNPSHFKGKNLPVECVSWNDAVEFCERLSQRDGKRYCLLTEEKWEYAARAGTQTPYWWGKEIDPTRANYYHGSGSLNRTVDVDQYAPNWYGLYQTIGNVCEWVQDPYSEDYSLAVKEEDFFDELSAVAAGATSPGTAGQPTATGTSRTTGSIASGSESVSSEGEETDFFDDPVGEVPTTSPTGSSNSLPCWHWARLQRLNAWIPNLHPRMKAPADPRVEAVFSFTAGTAVRRTASGSRRLSGTTTWGSVWPC